MSSRSYMMNTQNASSDTQRDTSSSIWISRLELRCKPDTPEFADGYVGGFVTVVVRCSSALEFVSIATKHLSDEGFEILAIEDLAPLSESKFELNELVRELADKAECYPLQWSTFDLYRNNDDL